MRIYSQIGLLHRQREAQPIADIDHLETAPDFGEEVRDTPQRIEPP